MKEDPRPGARAISDVIARRRFENRAEGQRLRRLTCFEWALWDKGILQVAGVDEAGMSRWLAQCQLLIRRYCQFSASFERCHDTKGLLALPLHRGSHLELFDGDNCAGTYGSHHALLVAANHLAIGQAGPHLEDWVRDGRQGSMDMYWRRATYGYARSTCR